MLSARNSSAVFCAIGMVEGSHDARIVVPVIQPISDINAVMAINRSIANVIISNRSFSILVFSIDILWIVFSVNVFPDFYFH